MSDKKTENINREKFSSRIFSENPYDIETFFEGLEIMASRGKELFFIDQFINKIRKNPEIDITTAVFEILRDNEIIKFE